MGNSSSSSVSPAADNSNQPLFQRLFRRYGVDPVLEDARRQFNPNTIFTMMRGAKCVITVKPRLDRETRIQTFVQASLAPGGIGGYGRLCLTLTGEAPLDTGGTAGKLLRRLLDDGIALSEEVIGWREEDGDRLWLLMAPTKQIRKKKDSAPLLEYEPFTIGLQPQGKTKLMKEIKEILHKKRDESESIDRSKPILVFLNPHSGSGKGPKVYFNTLQPMLRESGYQFSVVTTTHRNHAFDYIKNSVSLDDYGAIIIVSGDGLLYEAVQAIMAREDADSIRQKLPVGIVAGGSGNGLARSQIFEWGHNYKKNGIASSSARVARGKTEKLDLFRMRMDSGKDLYAFLSFGVGFFSDVDIESEKARWMGEPRFTLWSIKNLFSMRTYRAKISYLSGKPLCEADDDCPGQTCQTCWATTEDDFIVVYAVNVAYIGGAVFLAPRARKDDGLIWLLMVRKGISRYRMLKLMLRMESGAHTSMGEVEMVPCRAVKYEPLGDKKGLLTIDGEVADYEGFQAEMLPGHLRIAS